MDGWKTLDYFIFAFGAGCIIYGALGVFVNLFDDDDKK